MVKAHSISLWSAAGSTGRSTIALAVASELAEAGHSVFLLDADTVAPSLNLMLGLTDHPAGIAAACRLVSAERFDLEQLHRLSVSYSTGTRKLTLMTGLSAASRWPELTTDRVEQVLMVAAEHFDFIVCDLASSLEVGLRHFETGLERNALNRWLASSADQLIAVVNADPVGVHRYLAEVPNLQSLKLAGEQHILVNRLRNTVLGNSAKQQIAETLSRLAQVSVSGYIPDDPIAADLALRDAMPLSLAKRNFSARQAIELFVRNHILSQRSDLDRRVAKLV